MAGPAGCDALVAVGVVLVIVNFPNLGAAELCAISNSLDTPSGQGELRYRAQ